MAKPRTKPRSKKEQRQTSRWQSGEIKSSLQPDDEARLEGQLAALRTLADESASQLEREHEFGRRIIEIQDEQLWKQSQRPRSENGLSFIARRSGIPRSTLEPRIKVARAFTVEQVRGYAAKRLCLSVVAELARAEPELREDLEEAVHKGATFRALQRARAVGNAALRKDKPQAEVSDGRAVRVLAAKAAMLQAQADALAAAAQRKRERQRGQGPAPGEAPPKGFLTQEGESLYLKALAKKQEAEAQSQRAAELMTQAQAATAAAQALSRESQAAQQEATQRLAESKHVEAALAARAAALDGQQQALEGAAALTAEAAAAGQPVSAYLATRLAQAHAARTALEQQEARTAAQQAQAAQARAEADQLLEQAQAAQAEAEAQRQQLREEWAAALAEHKEARALRQQAEAERAGVQAQAAELARERAAAQAVLQREQGVTVREEALRELEAQAAAQQADLKAREAALAARALEVTRIARRELRVQWNGMPHNLDEVLDAIFALSTHQTFLCEKGREYLERDLGLVVGGLMDLRTANRASKAAREQMAQLADEICEIYDEYHPEEVAAYLEELRQVEEEEATDGNDDDNGAAGGPPPPPPPPVTPPPMPAYSAGFCAGGGVVLEGVSAAQGPKVPIEVLLGSGPGLKKQTGLLALTAGGGGVLIDLNRPQAYSIFGLQGSGKTSTILAVTEMLVGSHHRINHTPQKQGGIWAHFGKGLGYAPGIAKATAPNSERESVRTLVEKLGALPQAIQADLEVLVPPMREEQLAERRAQFPGMAVHPLKMTIEDFGLPKIRLFMAAGDSAAIYMSTLDQVFRGLNPKAQLPEIEAALAAAPFTPQGRALVEARWATLRPYLTGTESIRSRLKPSKLLVLDIRGDWINEREAMALFATLMETFSHAVDEQGQPFAKFIVFDEAQKYMTRHACSAEIVEMIREMRHRRMTVIIASQDPDALDMGIHKLSTITIVHKTCSIASLKVLRQGNTAWDEVSIAALAALGQGEVYIASKAASLEAWAQKAQPAKIRPTCAMPGGTTQTGVPEDV